MAINGEDETEFKENRIRWKVDICYLINIFYTAP